MTYCPHCRRGRPLHPAADFSLLALIAAVLFAVVAYQAGFEAGAAAAMAALDSYTP